MKTRTFLLAASALLATSTLSAATLYWDTNNTTAEAGTAAGTWSTSGGSSFWSADDTGTTAPGAWVDGSDVNFASGVNSNVNLGNVTVSGTVLTNNITFGDNLGVTISGGTIGFGSTLGTINSSAVGTANAKAVSISSALTGTAGLTIAAHGDLSDTGGGNGAYFQLGGDNSGLSGGITITSGLVDLTAATSVGSNAITLNGGGLLNGNHGNITLANAITIGASNGVVRTWSGAGTAFTLSGVLSGSGQLTKTDGGGTTNGALYISGANNTFTGAIRVGGGSVHLSSAGVLNNSGTYAGNITTISGTTFLYESSATQTFSGTLSNAGTFTQSAGSLNLSGTVTNSGTISVSGGTATLSGTVTGAGATTVSGGTLTLDYTTNNTNKLSTGALTLSGGTLSLTGNAAADTTQTVGSLSLTGAASLSLATQAGRTLTFDNSAGTRSGGGAVNLTTTGSGTGVFKFAGTAANSVLSWATWNGLAFAKTDASNQVNSTTQSTVNSTASDLSTWTSGATQYATTGAAFTNSVGAGVAIDGVTFQDAAARTVTIGTGNTLTLNNGVIVTSGVGSNVSTITGGTIRGSASGLLSLLSNNTSSSLTIASAIADNGGATGLAKYGVGTVIINRDSNTFSGPVTVNGGELQALVTTATGAKSTLGSGAITVNNGSTLRFKTGSTGNAMSFANAINLNGSNFYHEDGVMTFSGALTSTGTSTLNGVWGGKNGIFSNVVVSSGALTLQGSSSDTITALNIASGASFTATQSGVSIGTIAGAGSFTYSSGGNLTITGDNSALGYSGDISFGAAGGTFKVNSGAKLVTSGSFNQGWNKTNTIDGTLSTGGNLTIAVGATNTFGGTSGTINVTGLGSYFGLNNGTTVNFTNTGSLNVVQGNVIIGYQNNGANTLNQSAGTINALGLQLGSSGVTTAQTYALTGGRINLGANGITSVGTGTRTINLGAGTVGAQSNWASSLAIGLTDAVTGTTFNTLDSVDGVTGRVITLSNVLSGTGALAKAGAGTLILSGNNTYTGATTVNAGTLRLTGTNTSAITVNSGGTFSVASAATATTTGLLTLNAGSTFAADPSTTAAFTSNGVNFAGATSLLFNSALTSGSTYFVLNYGAGGVTNFANLAAKARGTLTNDSVNSRITFLAGTAGTRTWNTTSGTWDNLTAANFAEGDQMFSAGDTVVFGNPASASVITLAGQLAPASVSVTNTNDYTFSGSGAIAGASTLTKSGAGKLTLNTVNTYTGNTTISANGGTLELGGASLLGGGSYAGAIAIGTSGTLNVNTTANQTLSGVISGAGALVKNNTGTLSLSGANTFTGGATINQGTVDLTSGSASLRGTITVNSGGTLRLSGGDALGYSNNANSAQFVYLNGGTLTSAAGSNQTTSAEFILTGGTINGTVKIDLFNNGGKITTLASAAESTISVSSMNLRQNDTVFNIADGAAARDLVISSNLGDGSAGNHNMIKNGAGAMVLTGAGNSFTGSITINTGTLEIADAGRLGSGSSAQGVSIASGATFKVNSTAAQTLSGVISGSGTLVKDNSGTLTVSGNNTFTGNVTVSAGTVKVGNANAFGAANTAATKVTVASGATVDFNGQIDATYGYTIAGTGVGGNGALVNNGATIGTGSKQASNIALAADASIGGTGNWGLIAAGYGSTNLTLNGYTLTKIGANTVYLINTTITGGNVVVAGGVLATANVASTGTSTALTLNNTSGASLNLGANLTIGSLAGGGATGGNVSLGGNTLTVGALNTNTGFAGVISGTGPLVKNGAGALTLSSANTYTGGTTVNNGTLNVTGSLADAGAVTVDGASATYTVGANDTVGAVSLKNGATINGASTLTAASVAAESGTISAALAGSGTLTKSTSGTVTLSGSNTGFSGATTVSAGTLAAGNVNALGTGAVTVNGGTLALGANAVANTITVNSGGRLSATGGQSLTGPGALAVTLADGAGLTGTFGVFNSGTSAAKSFDVTGGASFTTLSGQGAFTGGIVTVTGAHNVGNSPGAQTFGSGLTYGDGATVTLEFDNLIASTGAAGVNWDTITVTGGLTLGSGVNLVWQKYDVTNAVDYAGAGWNSTFTKTLISYDTITGSFNLPSDITITGEGTWHLAQDATSVTATWTAVPEPSTYGLVGAGALAAVAFVRRRRKQAV